MTNNKISLVYFATPDIAVESFLSLINDPCFEVKALVTQPPRPNGRGKKIKDSKIKEERAKGLYKEDSELPLRKSHQNPDIVKLYEEFLEKPNSHKAHELLHTTYSNMFENSYRDLK